MNDKSRSIWALPEQSPPVREDELVAWRKAVEEVREIALAHSMTKVQVSAAADIPEGTFGGWYSGKYGRTTHNITERVQRWLNSRNEALELDGRILKGPGYIATPTAMRIMSGLKFAHQASEFAVMTLAAGLGKTMTCRHYQKHTPNVYMATMRPQTATVHGMLTEMCRVFDVAQNNPAKLDTAIGEKLRQKQARCCLIVDEAQNLQDRAVDQLRYLLDEYQLGIVLIGNEEVYKRFAGSADGPSFGQINRRVGYRIKQMAPHRGDITAVLDGWEVKDADCRKLLAAIGMKAGALGQITKTLQLASMMAVHANEKLTVEHIQEAWTNRAVEDA